MNRSPARLRALAAASRALHEALTDMAPAGPPCQVDGGALWFAEAASDRARAVAACSPCPLLALCGQRADLAREHYGVWGGVDRETTAEALRRRAASAAEAPATEGHDDEQVSA